MAVPHKSCKDIKETTLKGGCLPLIREGKVARNVEERQTIFSVLYGGIADGRNTTNTMEDGVCWFKIYSIQQLRH